MALLPLSTLAAAPPPHAAAVETHLRRPAINLWSPPKTATGSASALGRPDLTLAPRALGAGSILRTRRRSNSSSIQDFGRQWQPRAVRVKAVAASRRRQGGILPPPQAVRAAAAFALQRQLPAARSARTRVRVMRKESAVETGVGSGELPASESGSFRRADADGSGCVGGRGTASAKAHATGSESGRGRGRGSGSESKSANVGRTRMGEKTLKLYTHGLCPYAQRVSLTLVEKRVDPTETFHIDLANKPSWYYKVNPRGLVPAVELDGIVVTESLVICRALDDTFPHYPLMPTEDGQAKEAEIVRRLLRQSDDIIHAGLAVVAGPEHRQWSVDTSGRAADHRSLRRERERWLSAVETLCDALRQSGGPYLAGPSVTLADIALFPFIDRFDIALSAFRSFPLSSYRPILSAWLELLKERQHVNTGGGERSGEGGGSYSWAQTFPDRSRFLAALRRFKSLDYFDYHSASLADPNPI